MATRRIIPNYLGWTIDAKDIMSQDGAVEIVVPKNWGDNMRTQIFDAFRGHQISSLANSTHIYYLVSNERIRTSTIGVVKEAPKGVDLTTPVKAKEPTPKSFLEGFDDAASLEDLGHVSDTGTCSCCNKRLPLEQFTLRTYGGRLYKQSYCRKCKAAYDHWRYFFLKEYEAEHLVDEFTSGRKKRNDLFRQWFSTYHGE